MPIKLTREEFKTTLENIAASRPAAAQAFDVRLSFSPISFNLSRNDDCVVVRLVDRNGMLSDITLMPTLAIELASQLTKIMTRCNWIDTDGEPSLSNPREA